MNKQPYCTPPRWWSPRLSTSWVDLLRPLRQHWGRSGEGLVRVDVRQREYVQQAMDAGYGVLITPNHPSHADPYAMLAAADALKTCFYFMTAWQVFQRTHWFGRFVLRRHGCFSVNREGHDIRAMRQAIRILRHASQPLVMFPEGEVYHLNDRVMPFRRGALTLAQRAAARSDRPIVAIPAAIRYEYVADPSEGLSQTLSALEGHVGLTPALGAPLVERIRNVSVAELERHEQQYMGVAQVGPIALRRKQLIACVLSRVERQVGTSGVGRSIPERVKEARRRIIQQFEGQTPAMYREQLQAWLGDLFFVMQLFSYPSTYLSPDASITRVAETVDKLEEDLLGVSTTSERGQRRAVVTFGEPLPVPRVRRGRAHSTELTTELQLRVAQLLSRDASYSEETVFPRLARRAS